MPFIANTPESLVTRSDSKNPAKTCHGITSAGRPCRRLLTGPHEPVKYQHMSKGSGGAYCNGLRPDDRQDERFYCWQHKEQARASRQSSLGQHALQTPDPTRRSSIDTLADRLGLLAVNSAHTGPEMSRPQRPRNHSTLFCCFRANLGEMDTMGPQPNQGLFQAQSPISKVTGPSSASSMPSHMVRPSSIPPSVSPQIASSLAAELAKPVSQTDEPGYIYMFWLTPESQPSAPMARAVRSLLVDDSACTSTILAGTLLLKIGRANNVQRRLNEWQRQCGYNLSLIRYYPYISSSRASHPNTSLPRKLPHSHKVERLVHLELVGKGLRPKGRERCQACNREHREWFRVEASRKAVMEVDEIIRHWSDWDESRVKNHKICR